jgi:adenylate cyclase
MEIERKFLVDAEHWRQLAKPEPTHLRQGYIVNEVDKTIRVRMAGEKAYLTIKGATTGISRSEYEYPLPVRDAIELLDSFAVSWIEKKRYRINFAGHLWEVDEFLGDNLGLIVAEIELGHEAAEFELPGWISVEVSGDKRYYNSSLSIHPFKKWKR